MKVKNCLSIVKYLKKLETQILYKWIS